MDRKDVPPTSDAPNSSSSSIHTAKVDLRALPIDTGRFRTIKHKLRGINPDTLINKRTREPLRTKDLMMVAPRSVLNYRNAQAIVAKIMAFLRCRSPEETWWTDIKEADVRLQEVNSFNLGIAVAWLEDMKCTMAYACLAPRTVLEDSKIEAAASQFNAETGIRARVDKGIQNRLNVVPYISNDAHILVWHRNWWQTPKQWLDELVQMRDQMLLIQESRQRLLVFWEPVNLSDEGRKFKRRFVQDEDGEGGFVDYNETFEREVVDAKREMNYQWMKRRDFNNSVDIIQQVFDQSSDHSVLMVERDPPPGRGHLNNRIRCWFYYIGTNPKMARRMFTEYVQPMFNESVDVNPKVYQNDAVGWVSLGKAWYGGELAPAEPVPSQRLKNDPRSEVNFSIERIVRAKVRGTATATDDLEKQYARLYAMNTNGDFRLNVGSALSWSHAVGVAEVFAQILRRVFVNTKRVIVYDVNPLLSTTYWAFKRAFQDEGKNTQQFHCEMAVIPELAPTEQKTLESVFTHPSWYSLVAQTPMPDQRPEFIPIANMWQEQFYGVDEKANVEEAGSALFLNLPWGPTALHSSEDINSKFHPQLEYFIRDRLAPALHEEMALMKELPRKHPMVVAFPIPGQRMDIPVDHSYMSHLRELLFGKFKSQPAFVTYFVEVIMGKIAVMFIVLWTDASGLDPAGWSKFRELINSTRSTNVRFTGSTLPPQPEKSKLYQRQSRTISLRPQ